MNPEDNMAEIIRREQLAIKRAAFALQANPDDRTPRGLRKAIQVNRILDQMPYKAKVALVKAHYYDNTPLKIQGVLVVW